MSTPIILLLVIMVGGILLGFPIVWAMMSGCIACLMLEPNLVLTIVPQKVFLGLNNFAFLAIPLLPSVRRYHGPGRSFQAPL